MNCWLCFHDTAQRVSSVDAIVGHDLADQLARRGLEEIAPLARDLDAAPRHDARRQRQVVVRRKVEVIRRGELEAADLRGADGRREEARLALVRERELEPRRVHHWHAEKVHARIVSRADLAQLVDLDLVGAQVPVVVGRNAGRVLRLASLVEIGTGEANLRSLAVRLVLRNVEARLVEIADLALAMELDLGPADPVEPLAQRDLALRVNLVLLHVVREEVGQHRLAARAKLHLAERLDRLVAAALEAIGAQIDRTALFRRGGRAQRGRRRRRERRQRRVERIAEARGRRVLRRSAARRLHAPAIRRLDVARHAQRHVLRIRDRRRGHGGGHDRRGDRTKAAEPHGENAALC